MMKLDCCPGSTCTLNGRSFECIPDILDDDIDEEGQIEYEENEDDDVVKK